MDRLALVSVQWPATTLCEELDLINAVKVTAERCISGCIRQEHQLNPTCTPLRRPTCRIRIGIPRATCICRVDAAIETTCVVMHSACTFYIDKFEGYRKTKNSQPSMLVASNHPLSPRVRIKTTYQSRTGCSYWLVSSSRRRGLLLPKGI